jgi:hypothetical protein
LIFSIARYRPSAIYGAQEGFHIESLFFLGLSHADLIFPCDGPRVPEPFGTIKYAVCSILNRVLYCTVLCRPVTLSRPTGWPFMTLRDEYEMNVREAQRMADNSLSDTDKAAWLRIAQQWLRMLRTLRGNETSQEDQSGRPASRDDDFKTSH